LVQPLPVLRHVLRTSDRPAATSHRAANVGGAASPRLECGLLLLYSSRQVASCARASARPANKRPNGTVFQFFTYTYDANGNRITQADGTGATTFTYEALDRLTAAACPRCDLPCGR